MWRPQLSVMRAPWSSASVPFRRVRRSESSSNTVGVNPKTGETSSMPWESPGLLVSLGGLLLREDRRTYSGPRFLYGGVAWPGGWLRQLLRHYNHQ